MIDEGPASTLRGLPISRPGARTSPPRRRRRKLEGTELLARYKVETIIGRGGMATVYRGHHATIQREFAIKVLDPALDNVPDAVERFLQEAQVTSRVVHENVVEVTDFGVTADGVVFCVMELLHGETLAELLANDGPLPLPRAVAIMLQVCGALAAAHERGVIHRDLKPENCFRAPRTSNPDFIKVLDFGIARLADEPRDEPCERPMARPRRTQVGCIVGTPDYMAPEQARAERFDHRIDVYAAGCLLFELLTARAPYRRDSAADTIAAHLSEPIPDPRALVPTVPPAICAVIRKAMAKRADDRWPDMAALADALRAALLVPTPTRRARAWFVGAAMLAGVAATALATMSIHHAPTAAIAMASLGIVPTPSTEAPPIVVAPPVVVPAPAVALASPPPSTPSTSVPPPPVAAVVQASTRRRVRATSSPAAAPEVAPPIEVPIGPRAKISEVKDPFASP